MTDEDVYTRTTFANYSANTPVGQTVTAQASCDDDTDIVLTGGCSVAGENGIVLTASEPDVGQAGHAPLAWSCEATYQGGSPSMTVTVECLKASN